MLASRFSVDLTSPDPSETAKSLQMAGMEVRGPATAGLVDAGRWIAGSKLTAIVECESADVAEDWVKKFAGTGCEIGPGQAFSDAD